MSRVPFSREDWLTIPNLITLVRLLLLIPICYLLAVDAKPGLTAALLVIFGSTDWIDGYIARKYDQVSTVGEIIDPIADRLGLGLIAIFLVVGHHLPDWVAYCIIVTDLCLAALYLFFKGKYRAKVNYLGKVRTAILMVGLPLTVFGRIEELSFLGTVGVIAASVGAILHVITGGTYAHAIVQEHRATKANLEASGTTEK